MRLAPLNMYNMLKDETGTAASVVNLEPEEKEEKEDQTVYPVWVGNTEIKEREVNKELLVKLGYLDLSDQRVSKEMPVHPAHQVLKGCLVSLELKETKELPEKG
ncbi:hypothetical protein cypCar_00014020, partial [Cyprinus carpio]